MIKPTGWNTWDANHLNTLVHLPGRESVSISLFNRHSQTKKDVFDWRTGMRRLGPHASDGSYSEIDLCWDDLIITFETCGVSGPEPGMAVCRVKLAEGSKADSRDYLILVELGGAWGERLQANLRGSELFLSQGETSWRLRANQLPENPLPGSKESGEVLAFPLERLDLADPDGVEQLPDLIVMVEPVQSPHLSFEGAARKIDEQRAHYINSGLRTSGWLDDAAAGMMRGLTWNTIWEPVKGRICSPVSRDWCRNPFWGGFVLFDWDTFFAAMMVALEDPSLAEANLRAILQEITPNGFVPNFGSARFTSLDRSQPPVGAYVVLKVTASRTLAAVAPEQPLIAETYPLLLGWHRWWMPHRDGNGDGLLEWGSDPMGAGSGTLRDAMYESGLDNSPMYDQAAYNASTHTMELVDVGLNSLYALDAWALAEMAKRLGFKGDADALTLEYHEMAKRINQELWNEAEGIYQNKFWDGRFSPAISPTNFYPLIAGIAPYARARRMMDDHLLNPHEFWGRFVLPSISRGDPGYHSSERPRDGLLESTADYWRGRIWGPMNFLVCEGLRRSAFDSESFVLSQRSLDLFLGEWHGESHIHENYDDISGDGDNVPSSDPVYHWGGLLAYLGIQELVDYEPWKGWRFGNLGEGFAAVKGIRLDEGSLDVAISPAGLRLALNDLLIVSSDYPLILRGFHRDQGDAIGEIIANEPEVTLTFHNLPAGIPFCCIVNDGMELISVSPDGRIELKLPGHSHFEVKRV